MTTVQEKIDVLTMARDLLQEPSAWVRGCHAQNDRGEEIAPEDDHAVRFCLEGAIIRALTEMGESGESPLLGEIGDEIMDDGDGPDNANIVIWNDDFYRTHAEVLAQVDATLERWNLIHSHPA